nr:hypothetical protein [Angustibacter aerolatus]
MQRGDPVALAVAAPVGAGLWAAARAWTVAGDDLAATVAVLAEVEDALRPRWVWWSARQTATSLVLHGLRPATCWDVAAVHRLLHGGSDDAPPLAWAVARGLDPAGAPQTGQARPAGAVRRSRSRRHHPRCCGSVAPAGRHPRLPARRVGRGRVGRRRRAAGVLGRRGGRRPGRAGADSRARARRCPSPDGHGARRVGGGPALRRA